MSARALSLLLFAAVGLAPAFAHDPMSSRTIARLHGDRMELELKIAAETTWPLVQLKHPLAMFQMETFATTVRPALEEWARTSSFTVEDGGRRLPIKTVAVRVVEDNLIFLLTYPRPSGNRLNIQTLYLQHLFPGYISHVTVVDEAGKNVAEDIRVKGEAPMQVDLSGNKSRARRATTQDAVRAESQTNRGSRE